MKTITFLQPGDVVVKVRERNTERAGNIKTILDNVNRKDAPRELFIDATSAGKYDRYQLQKGLQKAGAKVTVHNGVNTKTNKPILVIRRLTEAEWKEYNS